MVGPLYVTNIICVCIPPVSQRSVNVSHFADLDCPCSRSNLGTKSFLSQLEPYSLPSVELPRDGHHHEYDRRPESQLRDADPSR